ncbi:hypothetical protein FRX31_014633, partial [Thalictrum thalictroides]
YLPAILIFTTNIFVDNFREDSVNGANERRDSFSNTSSNVTETQKSWRMGRWIIRA